MAARLPGWTIVVLLVQLALAGLFLFYGYSETWTNSQGRWSPSIEDIVGLSLPAAAVVLFGALAWLAARGGRRGLAAVLACSPLLLVLVVFSFMGVFY